ncbi:hypothetical protein IWW50_002483 [Coemansia erecta]|nr:hypothetical protein GGF43_003609 [Coemansia sp. RSA 2618]KAJ2826208.1 hypothetical protein IWW50_002483 [Coemansia erecta]
MLNSFFASKRLLINLLNGAIRGFHASPSAQSTKLKDEKKKLMSLLPWDRDNPKANAAMMLLQTTRFIRHLEDRTKRPIADFDPRMSEQDKNVNFQQMYDELWTLVQHNAPNTNKSRLSLFPTAAKLIKSRLREGGCVGDTYSVMGGLKQVVSEDKIELREICHERMKRLKDQLPWAKGALIPTNTTMAQQMGRLIDHFRNKGGEMDDFVPWFADTRIKRTKEGSAIGLTTAYLTKVVYPDGIPKGDPIKGRWHITSDALDIVEQILSTRVFPFTVTDYIAHRGPSPREKRKAKKREKKLQKKLGRKKDKHPKNSSSAGMRTDYRDDD